MDSVTQAGPCARTNQIDFDDEVVFSARQKLFDMARGRDRRPFCLVASMTHPHDPYVIPQAYWDRYAGVEIDMPRVRIPVERLDPHSRRLRHVCGLDLTPVSEAQTRAARRAYYGAVSYVDDQVGTLLTALGDCGFADDTIVLLFADHGDMLGERGLWYKMSFFEPACRIPLIVHAPGRFAPRRVAASASLVDLLPTLCELAGGNATEYAAPLDGRSLVPQLAGAAGEDEVIGEYLAEGAIAPLVMIKRGRYKFVHSPADPDQLYDLLDDPDELRNLAAEPPHSSRLGGVSRRGGAALGPRGASRGRDRKPAAASPGQRGAARRAPHALGFSAPARRKPAVRAERSGSRRPRSHGAVSAAARLTDKIGNEHHSGDGRLGLHRQPLHPSASGRGSSGTRDSAQPAAGGRCARHAEECRSRG